MVIKEFYGAMMINYIKGSVKAVNEQQLSVVSEAMQIGFAINVINSSSFSQNDDVELYIHMHWSQENGPSLYGFRTVQERELFVLINSCSGIGPRMALTILEQADAEVFIRAIQAHDIKALSQIKGIGAKKAEQLVLQLKDKVDKFIISHDVKSIGVAKHLKQVSDVLKSLNYSRAEIQQAVIYLRDQQYESDPSFDQVMRRALSFLAKKV